MERYELYCLEFPNKKRYIGISKNSKKRFMGHCKGTGLPVNDAIRKYGKESVCLSILVVGNKSYISDLEIKAIDKFKSRSHFFGYNISHGGDISPMKDVRSRDKMRNSLKNYYKSNGVCEETRKKISQGVRKKLEDPEYVMKLSTSLKAAWERKGGQSEEAKCRIREAQINLCKSPMEIQKRREIARKWWAVKGGHSEETRKKMSDSQRKRIHTPEEIAKMSMSLKGRVFSEDHRAKLRGPKSQEHRDNISKSLKNAYKMIDMSGSNNPMFGKKHSQETRMKIKAAMASRRRPDPVLPED